MMTCNLDGLLLKPSYSATPLDSMIVRRAELAKTWPLELSKTALPVTSTGEVNVAYSSISSASKEPSHDFLAVIAMDLREIMELRGTELGFTENETLVVWRKGSKSADVLVGGRRPVIRLHSCRKSDYQLVYVSREGKGGVTLLGEGAKIVPHSPMRFSELDQSKNGEASVNVAGIKGETVIVTWFVSATHSLESTTCVFSATGVMRASYSTVLLGSSDAERCLRYEPVNILQS
eukprot:gnl/TRDRNA2_/TRDRNA2_157863_c2_seq2.p1 gnl/TRDRNA2_/TRDRNA2_157863_c2~~gnl/TRDRNA2_/TRDRNA2_157863_c2_seq2.p1  ORF type:complete len:234 (-),score=22.60 gnl/TRDRNA2_/TRDRNA2_157863_c2_seq2:12-713(-)